MDLEDWRDLTFTIFAALLIVVLLLLTAIAVAVSYLVIKGLSLGRSKLAEARPTVSTIRQATAKVEAGASNASDTVASPFIKARGLVNAVKEGAMALVRGREAGG